MLNTIVILALLGLCLMLSHYVRKYYLVLRRNDPSWFLLRLSTLKFAAKLFRARYLQGRVVRKKTDPVDLLVIYSMGGKYSQAAFAKFKQVAPENELRELAIYDKPNISQRFNAHGFHFANKLDIQLSKEERMDLLKIHMSKKGTDIQKFRRFEHILDFHNRVRSKDIDDSRISQVEKIFIDFLLATDISKISDLLADPKNGHRHKYVQYLNGVQTKESVLTKLKRQITKKSRKQKSLNLVKNY